MCPEACYSLIASHACAWVQDHADVRAIIPRRSDLLADRGVLVVCYATHKKRAYSFFLVQVSREGGGEGGG